MKMLCSHILSSIALMAAVFALALSANAIVYQQWDFRTAGPQHIVNPSCGVGVDRAGNSYICGNLWRPSGDSQPLYTMKFGPAGDTLWTVYYGGTNYYCLNYDMAVDPEGNVYITGSYSRNWDYYDYLTLKYNTQGQLQWVVTYNGPGDGDDVAGALALDSAGNVYVTGRSEGQGTNDDFATVKYNSQGQQMWVARYNSAGSHYDRAIDLAADGEGNVYVTGLSSTGSWPDQTDDIVTIKYSSQGEQRWVVTYDGPTHHGDDPSALKLDDHGHIYVAGISWAVSGTGNYVTLKYNSSGVPQWIAQLGFQQAGNSFTPNLAIEADGSVIMAGYSNDAGIITSKFDSDGVQRWVQAYSGAWPGYFISKPGLALDASHNIYVTGCEGPDYDQLSCVTLKYNAQGNLNWLAKYNPDACVEEGSFLTLDEHGNLFLSGDFWWQEYGEPHPLLVKYNQPAGNIVATMTPTVMPVVIPAQGGSFSYSLQTFNTVQNNLATDFWWKVIYPSGSTVSLGPVAMVLPLDSASFQRTQHVPGNIPSGIYKYILYAGDYPNFIWATDTILIVKTSTANGPLVAGNWSQNADEESPPLARGAGGDKTFSLYNSPNPFNLTTAISYELRVANHVSLKVYDTAGRLVATLVEGWAEAGSHEVTFDGSRLASGIYVYTMKAGNQSWQGKMVLLK